MRRIPRRRGGWLLPSVVVIGLVILGLAGIYYLASQQQTGRGHRFKGTLVGRFLAEGAVELVRHAVRDYAHPRRRRKGPPQAHENLMELCLAPPSQLQKGLETARARAASSSVDDDRELLARLLEEPKLGELLEGLAATVRGSEVRVFVEVEESPLPGKPEWYADVVPKGLTLLVTAEARYGGTVVRHRDSEAVVVYPVGSPVLGKFTGNHGFQLHEPGQAFPSKPFDLERPDLPLLGEGAQPPGPGALAKRFQDRGWVWPRHQVVAPGGGVLGMHGLIWRPEDGAVPTPRSLLFEEPPEGFDQEIPHPTDPLTRQRPLLEGLVQGIEGPPKEGVPLLDYPFSSRPVEGNYYDDDPGTYAPAPPVHDAGPGPFGTSLDPSPTYAPGSRMRLYAISAVTVDRDAEDRDEEDQRAAVGQALPFREGTAYMLPQAPEDRGEYREAIRPVDGELPAGPMPTIPEEPPGSGRGELANRNRQADLDGDGFPETLVTSELPYPKVPVFTDAYHPGALLPEPDDFQRVSSRVLDLPLHLCMELSSLSWEDAQRRLHEIAWGPGGSRQVEEWEELPYGLEHRDPLHQQARLEEAERLHYGVVEQEARSAGETPGLLRDRTSIEAWARQRWMPEVVVYGQEDLERFFPDGDLRGLRVTVFPPAEKEASRVVLRRPYRNGVLTAALVEVPSGVPAQPVGEPLEVFAWDVVLGPSGESHLAVFTPEGGIHGLAPEAGKVARLRGAAWVGTAAGTFQGYAGPSEALERALADARRKGAPAPLMTIWDDARDPLREDAHAGYRLAWAGLR